MAECGSLVRRMRADLGLTMAIQKRRSVIPLLHYNRKRNEADPIKLAKTRSDGGRPIATLSGPPYSDHSEIRRRSGAPME